MNRAWGRKYKIYVLIDPRDKTVRYVGQTKDPLARQKLHADADTNSSVALKRWKHDLQVLGLAPELEVVDSAHEGDWKAREGLWITYYRERGRLYNKAANEAQRLLYGGSTPIDRLQPMKAKQIASINRPQHEANRTAKILAAEPKKESLPIPSFLELTLEIQLQAAEHVRLWPHLQHELQQQHLEQSRQAYVEHQQSRYDLQPRPRPKTYGSYPVFKKAAEPIVEIRRRRP